MPSVITCKFDTIELYLFVEIHRDDLFQGVVDVVSVKKCYVFCAASYT